MVCYQIIRNHNLVCIFPALLVIFTSVGIALSQSDSLLHPCISHPVSLSNITTCYDKTCNITAIAAFTHNFDGTSETCIDFGVANNSAASTIHFAASKTATTYPLLNCYFTDDPYFNLTYHCSCLIGFCKYIGNTLCSSVYTQSTCPLPNTTFPSIFDNGVAIQSDCLGSLTGNWCSRISIQAYARYKICELGDPTYSALFSVHDGESNTLLSGFYSGYTKDYNVTGMNITITNTIGSGEHKGKFILWDKHDMSNYYLLDSSSVNDINSYNSLKIGWLKVINGGVYHKLTEHDFEMGVKSCYNNIMSLRTNVINIAAYLSTHRQFLGIKTTTDRLLFDNEFVSESSDEGLIPNHIISPYTYVFDGTPLYAYAGGPEFFGVSKNYSSGIYKITFKADMATEITLGVSVLFSNGIVDYSYYINCVRVPISRTANASLNIAEMLCITMLRNGLGYSFATCPIKNSADSDLAWANSCKYYNGSTVYVDNIQFWPENVMGKLKFNGTFHKEVLMDLSGGTFHEYSGLFSTLITISYSNISIQFTTNSVKPKLYNCVPFLDLIRFDALSLTNPGSCYVETQPLGLTPTESIYLDNKPDSYHLNIITDNYSGIATIVLRCLRYQVSCNVELNYSNNGSFTTKDNMFDYITTSFNPFNTFKGLNSYLDRLMEYIPWQFVSILLWVTIGLLILAVLYYIIRKFLYRKAITLIRPKLRID